MRALPSKKILAEATVAVLKESKEMLKAAEVNTRVASLLNIPQEIMEIEDANCTGTEFSYQMRWVRTDLKKKGILLNPQRGYWIINSITNE